MTLGEELDLVLRPGRVQVEKDGLRAEIDVEDADRLGATVRRIRVEGPPGDLAERAAALPEALERGLGERLRPVEVAPELGGAVLRGRPDRGRFVEAQVEPGAIQVEHQQIGESGRTPTPWTLTREQLGRVVDGLGEVARKG